MNISSYIGKPVISPEGAAYGYVTDVRLSLSYEHISCIVCADAEEEEFSLPLRAVKAAGDALIVGKARLKQATGTPSPIGRAVYACTGELLGTVSDVVIGEGPARLVVTKEGEGREVPFAFAQLGESVVLYPEEVKKRAKARRPASPKPHADPPPESESEAPMSERKASVRTEKPEGAVVLNRTNLLGRRVKRTLYDRAGVPIVLEGTKITPAILAAARQKGKLLELMVCTLT